MPQPPVDSALNPPNPPRKRRIGIYRFLLLTTLPLLGLLLALCAVIALNLHDIETRANTADTEQLPAIFAGQRALINLESLRRYAVIMFAADDPSMRREAGVNALSMVSEIAFDPSAHFSDHATKTRALIYSLSAARSESDDLDQDLTAAMRRMGLLAARLTARVSGVLPGDEAKRREHLDKLAVFPFRGRDHAEDRLRYREETLAPLLRLCAEQGGEAAQDCADLEAAWKEAVNLWERRDIASRDARSAWRELDYTLRDIGEAASIAEAEASYQAMRRISAES